MMQVNIDTSLNLYRWRLWRFERKTNFLRSFRMKEILHDALRSGERALEYGQNRNPADGPRIQPVIDAVSRYFYGGQDFPDLSSIIMMERALRYEIHLESPFAPFMTLIDPYILDAFYQLAEKQTTAKDLPRLSHAIDQGFQLAIDDNMYMFDDNIHLIASRFQNVVQEAAPIQKLYSTMYRGVAMELALERKIEL